MKVTIQIVALILIIVLVWQWVKTDRDNDFKYNLPPVGKTVPPDHSDLAPIYSKPLSKVPLVSEKKFELNEAFQPALANLTTFIFDSLKLEQLSIDLIPHTNLANLDAATIIQLQIFVFDQVNGPTRSESLSMVGLLLNAPGETLFYVREYLMTDHQWLFTIQRLHRMLMQEPESPALNRAFMAMIQPASTEQVLDYMIEIQFLDRGHEDDYYEVNPEIMERFDTPILQMLLDKVDDYAWYAAYPERDAEQGILEILKRR